MSQTDSCSIFFLVIVGSVWPSDGKVFMPHKQEVEASLLAQLAGTFRAGANIDNVISLEAALRPMHAAVPQEANGRLSQNVACYVLHRLFAKRGWFIRGFEQWSGMGNRSPSTLQALQEWVPSYLTEFLENTSGGHGLSSLGEPVGVPIDSMNVFQFV